MKDFLEKVVFLLKGTVYITISLILMLMACVAIFLAILLGGCGQADSTVSPTMETRKLSSELSSADSIISTVSLNEKPEKGFYVAEDLGSHVMYITQPKVDAELQAMMDKYQMNMVEVYFRKDEGDEKPALATEPKASAVYYVVPQDAESLTISWHNSGKDMALADGVHLDDPVYVMKYTVASEDAKGIGLLVMEDFGGGAVFYQNLQKSSFGVDSLFLDAEELQQQSAADNTPVL